MHLESKVNCAVRTPGKHFQRIFEHKVEYNFENHFDVRENVSGWKTALCSTKLVEGIFLRVRLMQTGKKRRQITHNTGNDKRDPRKKETKRTPRGLRGERHERFLFPRSVVERPWELQRSARSFGTAAA